GTRQAHQPLRLRCRRDRQGQGIRADGGLDPPSLKTDPDARPIQENGETAVDTAPSGPPGPTAAAAAPPSRAGRDLTRAIPVGDGLGALVIASIAFTPRAWYLVAAGAVAIGTWEVFKRLRQARFALPLFPLLAGGQAMVWAGYLTGAEGAFAAFAVTGVVVLVWRLLMAGLTTAPKNYMRDVSVAVFVLVWIAVPGALGAMLSDGDYGAQRVVALILL